MEFEYFQPVEIDDALRLLNRFEGKAQFLAGGMDLVMKIKHQQIAPSALICLENIPNLRYIKTNQDGLSIGAMTRLSEIAQNEQVRRFYPSLAEACSLVGNVRVRHQASIGGNLAAADYATDPPTVLSVLNAVVTAVGKEGSREIPIMDFFHINGTTALAPDELLTEIYVPALPPDARQVYLKYKSRSGEDRPCIGTAAEGVFQDGVCRDLRIAIGAACEKPYRNAEWENLAIGRKLDDGLIAEIAASYANRIEPVEDLRGSKWYHARMAEVFVRRALEHVRNRDR